jgi:TonB family protein
VGRVIISKGSALWPWALASLSVHAALLTGLLLAWPVGGPDEGFPSDNVEVELLPVLAKPAAPPTEPGAAQAHQIEKRPHARSATIPEPEAVKPATPLNKPVEAMTMNNIKGINNDKLGNTVDKQDEANSVPVENPASRPQQDDGKAMGEAETRAETARNLAVRQRLEQFKQYPIGARRRGIEGAVDVSFRLNDQGRAEDMQLVSGSGYDILDEAALDTVHRAEPFPVHGGSYRFRLRFTRS